MTETVDGLHAIVPAGGAGTRLWPVSRSGHPKFLLDLTGAGRTLLQQTWDRLVPLTGPDRVVVVTGVHHAGAVAAQLPGLGAERLLAEPSPRDSMAAIGLATVLVHRDDPDAVVASFAADHVIGEVGRFHDAVRGAVEVARDGLVCTIGITPTGPSTAFGYVEAGEPLAGRAGARGVRRFVEKPDAATAATYLAEGGFWWNAGMFVARADVLLGHLAHQQPRLHEGLTEIADAWDGPGRGAVLERVWRGLTRIAIDHAIAEPVAAAGGMAVVPGAFGWDDVGDVASLASLLAEVDGVRVLGDADAVGVVDGSGLVVTATGRTVSVLGLDDVVVLDTPDAVLVTTLAHAQRVKEVVAHWRAHGRDDLL